MKKILDYLEQLGLSEVEAKLYQGLLEKGPATVMELADHLGIKRITAHFNVENLIQKGLISQTKKGARRQIVAESPDRLEDLVEKQCEKAQGLRDNFPDIAKSLQSIIPTTINHNELKVRYYEGKNNVKPIYDEMLNADEVYSFVNLDKYYAIFPGTENLFKQAFEKNPQRKFWAITVDTPFARSVESDEKENYKNYLCKYIPRSEKNPIFAFADLIEYQIYNNKVAIIQSVGANVVATVIESPLVYSSFKGLHNFIWELLK